MPYKTVSDILNAPNGAAMFPACQFNFVPYCLRFMVKYPLKVKRLPRQDFQKQLKKIVVMLQTEGGSGRRSSVL